MPDIAILQWAPSFEQRLFQYAIGCQIAISQGGQLLYPHAWQGDSLFPPCPCAGTFLPTHHLQWETAVHGAHAGGEMRAVGGSSPVPLTETWFRTHVDLCLIRSLLSFRETITHTSPYQSWAARQGTYVAVYLPPDATEDQRRQLELAANQLNVRQEEVVWVRGSSSPSLSTILPLHFARILVGDSGARCWWAATLGCAEVVCTDPQNHPFPTPSPSLSRIRLGKVLPDCWGLRWCHTRSGSTLRSPQLMMVRRDLNTSEEVELSKQLKKGVHIIGMSSYQCFPQPLTNPHDTPRPSFMERHGHHVIAWLHCFRDPHHYIPPSIPSMLLSESDLYRNAETVQSTPRQDISFDFVCSINDGEWNAYIRRLDVAQRWLNYMADEMHLRILVLGCAHSRGFSPRITCEPFLPWRQFLSRLTSARYLFSSSQHDASPRLIVESMLLGLPVLINAHILGGWKYVQPSTGALYHTEDDIQSTITQFMGRVYAPQPWIQDHLRQSQMVCARFLQSVFSLQWSQFIDATIYINLDHRHDRNKAIKQELRAHEISPFHRISATLDERCGHLGCTRSHIRALQLAQSKGWQRVLVLEDDFKWRVPRERALHMVSTFLHRYQHNWDVLLRLAKAPPTRMAWYTG